MARNQHVAKPANRKVNARLADSRRANYVYALPESVGRGFVIPVFVDIVIKNFPVHRTACLGASTVRATRTLRRQVSSCPSLHA